MLLKVNIISNSGGKISVHDDDAAAAELLQSCPTLCDPIDDSPPGSPVPGILQARTLEWGAIAFSGWWRSLYYLNTSVFIQKMDE